MEWVVMHQKEMSIASTNVMITFHSLPHSLKTVKHFPQNTHYITHPNTIIPSPIGIKTQISNFFYLKTF